MFPIGCYVGYLAKNGIKIHLSMIGIFVLCSIVLFYYGVNEPVTRSCIGIPLACLLMPIVFKDGKNDKIRELIKWFGQKSLELYLLHVIIYFAIQETIGLKKMWLAMVIAVCCAIIICEPISLLIKKITQKIA